MSLRGRFLSSEFKSFCCWLTGMKVEAGVWAIALWKVPITARLLLLSCRQLSNHCCSFCYIPLLGCRGLCFVMSFAGVALIVNKKTLFLPAGGRKFLKAVVYQNLFGYRTSWSYGFERSYFAFDSFDCRHTSLEDGTKVVAAIQIPWKRGSICTRYCRCFNCNARRYLNLSYWSWCSRTGCCRPGISLKWSVLRR